MKNTTALTLIATAVLLAACSKPAETPVASAAPAATQAAVPAAPEDHGIAWKRAVNDADVDAAFTLAKAEKKPVFLYWGAKWCPPCNQLKATLFNRQDFIERSRAFVPVYVDGDSPGAQKLGTRFKVRGYPTMVMFNADGAELTRLPGEVDAAQYTEVLTLGMNAQRPLNTVLASARAGGEQAKSLTAADWRLLAFYSWETDEQQAVPKDQVPALLKTLAAACPADQPDTATRLNLKAIASGEERKSGPADAAAVARVQAVLADAAATRSMMDIVNYSGPDIVKATTAPGTPERAKLVGAFDSALKRLQADTSLSRADRVASLDARIGLVKLDLPKDAKVTLPEALIAEVREQAARFDKEITDGYERQSVVTSSAYVLGQAGLIEESDALLKANLTKSHSPYYLMSSLASNAKKRGDKAEALRWSQEAFDKSEGPATRLQWGASYMNTLVELAPQEEARIEGAAQQLFKEAAEQPNAFYERSARSLQRVGTRLQEWNKGGAHQAVLTRLQTQLDGVCAKLPADDAGRAVCTGLLKPAAAGPKRAA